MSDRFSFDPIEYLLALWHMLPVLIISLIVGAVGGLTYSNIVSDHLYGATTKFYVISGDWATESRADDYAQIITSQSVTRAVITRKGLKDANGMFISNEALLKMVEVSAYDETHVISITCFNRDPYLACDVANVLREVSVDAIAEIMNPATIKVVQKANIPVYTVRPNTMLQCVTGAIALFVATLVIIFLRMLLVKQKTEKNSMKLMQPYIIAFSVIGVICAAALMINAKNTDRIGPEIIFPEGDITYVEGEDYDLLLKDVKAEDVIDGDCTEFIRIDDVYVSESGESCVVDYVVKDKSNNVSITERIVSYRKTNPETEIETDAEENTEADVEINAEANVETNAEANTDVKNSTDTKKQ